MDSYNVKIVKKPRNSYCREKAVLSAFDILEDVATKAAGNEDAASTMAVASFPTHEDFTNGWKIEGKGWLTTSGATERQALIQSMAFSRLPFGLTPYGAGFTAATQLFSTVPNDGKAKILVLVTDGEPTDRDPLGVINQTATMKSSDIEIITVFITGSASRPQRKAAHADMLRTFNDSSIAGNRGPWYNANIANIEDYITVINGNAQTSDLVSKVSTQTDLACVEAPGKKCDRLIVEVSDSASLRSVLESIIKTRAIKCE